ncbi:MAG: hypothetical protein IJE43_19015 [Alphaproteobacteria bacterium]|nr:hypothetical protein [Alphaproteobacteria bacterium]
MEVVYTSTDKYTVADLDRELRNNLLDIIDYQHRSGGGNLEAIVSNVLPELQEKVSEYYKGIPGITFELVSEDFVQAYKKRFI